MTTKIKRTQLLEIFTLLFIILTFHMDVNFAEYFFPNLYSWKELMISYEGGFIRRGLLGEFFYLADNFISITILAPILFLLCFIFITVTIFNQANELKLPTVILVAIIFSPTLILFNLHFNIHFMRKEILIYVGMLILGLFLSRNKKTQSIKFSFFALTIISFLSFLLLTLIYETTLVWIPFICYLIYGSFSSDVSMKKKCTQTFFFGFILFLTWSIIVLPFKGDLNSALAIYKSWHSKYQSLKLEGADPFYFLSISSNPSAAASEIKRYLMNPKLWLNTLFMYAYSLLPFIYILYTNNVNVKKEFIIFNKKITIFLMFLISACPLILCLVGFTFGRWVSFTNFILLFLFFFCLEPNKQTHNNYTTLAKTVLWSACLLYINVIGFNFNTIGEEQNMFYWFNFRYVYQQLITLSFIPY